LKGVKQNLTGILHALRFVLKTGASIRTGDKAYYTIIAET